MTTIVSKLKLYSKTSFQTKTHYTRRSKHARVEHILYTSWFTNEQKGRKKME